MDAIARYPGTRALITVASLMLIIKGLEEAEPLLVPLVFAAFLSTMAAPAVMWLKAKRVPTVLGVPLVVVGLLGALSGIGALVGGSVTAFVQASPRYRDRLDVIFGDAFAWLSSHGVVINRVNVQKMINPGAAIDVVGDTLSGLAAVLSNVLLVLLLIAFMLFEVAELPDKVRAAAGGEDEGTFKHYGKVATQVKQYVLIKTYMSAATGVIVGIAMWIIGIDFPLLWGLLAFLLNYIPNIGSVIAAVPPVLLALVQFGVGRALIVLGVFVGVNMVVGNVVEPPLMGRRLGLSSLVVFVSLVFWGWLWGPMGMLLSVPLTMVVKIMLEHNGQWHWIAILMDGASPTPRASLPPPTDEEDSSDD